MRNFLYFKIIICLGLVRVIIFGHSAPLLDLDEGVVCRKGEGKSSDHVCRQTKNCPSLEQDIKRNKFPEICSFVGSKPVVCCSPVENNITASVFNPVKSYWAAEICHQYAKLVYTDDRNISLQEPERTDNTAFQKTNCHNVLPLIVGGDAAEPMEFPHMALLGYVSQITGEKTWGCGGSLISNRWIMSAAHCAINSGQTVSWARLGDLNIYSTTDDAKPKEYEIVERVLHPHYKPSHVYDDIALFRLETDVEFSAYVRPVCLNTDPTLRFGTASATGWGRTRTNGPISPDLLKVYVKPVSIDQCMNSYPPSENPRINLGILEESMICAGDFKDGNDTCAGDSGGPLQIQNTNYSCMYTQIGITSFGKYCGSKSTPGVYTRVSNYIAWIERTVWPKN